MADYRVRYRREEIGPAYRGWLHFGFTSAVSLGVILLSISRLEGVGALEWLTIPLVLLYANLAEYLGHRGPMHRPVRGLKLIYQRHAKQHHRFFTDQAMAFDSARDFEDFLAHLRRQHARKRLLDVVDEVVDDVVVPQVHALFHDQAPRRVVRAHVEAEHHRLGGHREVDIRLGDTADAAGDDA